MSWTKALSRDFTSRRLRRMRFLIGLVAVCACAAPGRRGHAAAMRPARRRARGARPHQHDGRRRRRGDRASGTGAHAAAAPATPSSICGAHVHARVDRHARPPDRRVQRKQRDREVPAEPARLRVPQHRVCGEDAARGLYDRARSRRRRQHLAAQRRERAAT